MYIVTYQCKAFSTSLLYKTVATPTTFSDSDTTSVCLCVSRHDHICTQYTLFTSTPSSNYVHCVTAKKKSFLSATPGKQTNGLSTSLFPLPLIRLPNYVLLCFQTLSHFLLHYRLTQRNINCVKWLLSRYRLWSLAGRHVEQNEDFRFCR